MSAEKTYTQAEVKEIVDKMARTLAMLYYFMGDAVTAEFGSAGEEAVRRAIHKYGEA